MHSAVPRLDAQPQAGLARLGGCLGGAPPQAGPELVARQQGQEQGIRAPGRHLCDTQLLRGLWEVCAWPGQCAAASGRRGGDNAMPDAVSAGTGGQRDRRCRPLWHWA